MRARDLQAFLRSIEAESVERLRALVGINSFTLNRDGVNEMGRASAALLRPLGFDARAIPSADGARGDHLFLRREGSGGPEVLLLAHLDTVFSPEEERRVGFSWREEGDRILGPGVVDIKGGIVVLHMALRALEAVLPDLFGGATWHVLLDASEEGGCEDFPREARALVTERTAACLVFEPGFEAPGGGTTITWARKGGARILVEAFGREAHSGNAHERGASAIRELAGAVERIERLTDYARDLTCNVGVIEGGSFLNTVPAYARCLVDVRARTMEDYLRGIAEVEALAGEGVVRSAADGFPCTVKVSRLPSYPPWPENPGSARLAALCHEAAAEAGLRVEPTFRRGASDACHLWDLVPTLDGLGAVGGNLHCSRNDPSRGQEPEFLRRSSLVERALLAALLLGRLAGGTG